MDTFLSQNILPWLSYLQMGMFDQLHFAFVYEGNDFSYCARTELYKRGFLPTYRWRLSTKKIMKRPGHHDQAHPHPSKRKGMIGSGQGWIERKERKRSKVSRLVCFAICQLAFFLQDTAPHPCVCFFLWTRNSGQIWCFPSWVFPTIGRFRTHFIS